MSIPIDRILAELGLQFVQSKVLLEENQKLQQEIAALKAPKQEPKPAGKKSAESAG